MSFITVTEEVERNGLHEMLAEMGDLKVCCERDFGCNEGTVRDSRVRVDYWKSKLGLPDYLSFKAPLINGVDTVRPEKVVNAYLGDAVSFGDGGGRNQIESTWVPTGKFTLAVVTANASLNQTPSAFVCVNDTSWMNIQNFVGATIFEGNSLTEATSSTLYTYAPPSAPISSTKAHLIQVEWAPAGATAGNIWLNNVEFVGADEVWEDVATIDYIRIGGSAWAHKAIYIFDGAVDSTDLFNWVKARYPEITF